MTRRTIPVATTRRAEIGEYAIRREPFETESRLVVRITGPRYDDYDRRCLCIRQSAAEKLAALLNAARDLAYDWRGIRTTGIFGDTDPEFDVRHTIVDLLARRYCTSQTQGVLPWDASDFESGHHGSLWEMVNFTFWVIAKLLSELAIQIDVSDNNQKHVERNGGYNDPRIKSDPKLPIAITQACDTIAWIEEAADKHLKRLKCVHIDNAVKSLGWWAKGDNKRWHDLFARSVALRNAVEAELKLYLYYRYPKAKGDKLRTWREDWATAFKAFPAIENEAFCAIDCYALDHNTASVFHSMRVAEYGLRALARERRVKLPKNKQIEWATWQDIIKALDDEIKIIGSKKAGAAKDAALEFYSGARADLNGFKDEYRNLVMHVRAMYDEHQAIRALTQVHAFMERIGSKIDEKGTRIRWGLR